jgi:hypothetical protein
MTEPDSLRASMCIGKAKHETKADAQAVMSRMRSKGHVMRGHVLHVYECPYCSFFHLGHTKKDAVK